MRYSALTAVVFGFAAAGQALAGIEHMPAHWMNKHCPYIIHNRYWWRCGYSLAGPTDVAGQPVRAIGPPPFGPRWWYRQPQVNVPCDWYVDAYGTGQLDPWHQPLTADPHSDYMGPTNVPGAPWTGFSSCEQAGTCGQPGVICDENGCRKVRPAVGTNAPGSIEQMQYRQPAPPQSGPQQPVYQAPQRRPESYHQRVYSIYGWKMPQAQPRPRAAVDQYAGTLQPVQAPVPMNPPSAPPMPQPPAGPPAPFPIQAEQQPNPMAAQQPQQAGQPAPGPAGFMMYDAPQGFPNPAGVCPKPPPDGGHSYKWFRSPRDYFMYPIHP